MRIPFAKQIAWYLVMAMFILGVAPGADASMAPSSIIASSGSDRTFDVEQIRKTIETKMVMERLEKLGFSVEEIRAKVDNLSDSQVHQLALQLDDLRVGQDGALGVIVVILVIAILVVLLLHFTGHRVVVTK